MRRTSIFVVCVAATLLLASCSPRNFLTRRLAADLIAGSNVFSSPQPFQLHVGVISNKDYLSSNYLALQHRGWIAGTNAPCAAGLGPPPCWAVALTPSGVDTFQSLIDSGDAEKKSFSIPVARRELIAITGIARQGSVADVEFTWRWSPLNEVGAALYSGDTRYRSIAIFRLYDDGWRVVPGSSLGGHPLDEALKDAEPAS